jgi:hypothetical protein
MVVAIMLVRERTGYSEAGLFLIAVIAFLHSADFKVSD